MEKERTKQKILEAAKKVFSEKGYNTAGVSDIIESANIARGTFYLYFKSKRDVFSALMEYTIEQIDNMLTAIPLDTPKNILPHIKEQVLKVLKFFESDQALATLIIREATSLDSQSWDRLNEGMLLLADWIISYLKSGQAYGVLRNFNPNVFGFMFLGALRELLLQYMLTGFLNVEIEEMVDTLLSVFLFGILSDRYRTIVGQET